MGDLLAAQVGAVSVGIRNETLLLDLNYEEDSTADVDFNVVMTSADGFVEVQGTAERRAFSREQMNRMLDLAAAGIRQLFVVQQQASDAAPAE